MAITLFIALIFGIIIILYYNMYCRVLNKKVSYIYENHKSLIPTLLNISKVPAVSELKRKQKLEIVSISEEEWKEWDGYVSHLYTIRSKYKAAFDEFIKECYPDIQSRNSYKFRYNSIDALTLEEAKMVNSETDDVWQERQRIKLEADKIEKNNRDGIVCFYANRKGKPVSSKEIVNNKLVIESYQKRIDESRSYDGWEERQSDFFSKSLAIIKDKHPNYGRFKYDVPYKKPNRDGLLIDSQFKILQCFSISFSPFCREMQSIRALEVLKIIPKINNCTLYFKDNYYDKIFSFIEDITENDDVKPLIIFVTYNSQGWGTNTFDYHYKRLRTILDDNNYDWCNLNDIQTINDYRQWKTVLVFDLITTNEEMKMNSSLVVEFFKSHIPCVEYFSIFKQLDETETKDTFKDYEKRDFNMLMKEYKRVEMNSYFSYMAITNTLIGEADGADDIKPIWLENPEDLQFRTDDSRKGYIEGEYSLDGGRTYHNISIEGDYDSIDDHVKFAQTLFYKMGVMLAFKINGSKAIDSINQNGYLKHK